MNLPFELWILSFFVIAYLYNFPFLVSIQTKMGASYALFVEFSSRRDAFDGRKYLLYIDIFDVISILCQNCKFSAKNQRAIRI